jgi:hypothetical protein
MRRRIPGLSAEKWLPEAAIEGTFLVRVESAEYCHDSRKPFFAIKLELLQPQLPVRHLLGRLYCTRRTLWKLDWFLRDFGYDTDLLGREQIDDKALVGLVGIVRTTRRTLAGRSFLNFEAFAPKAEWDFLSSRAAPSASELGDRI